MKPTLGYWLMISPGNEKYAPRGSICKVHNLYQSKPDERGRTSWTKNLPDNLEIPAENSESSQYALIVRNQKCYDGRRNLEIHSIVVQSKPLKKFLADVMKGYPSLTMSLDRVEFHKPFKPFIYRWEKFTKTRDNNDLDETTKAHVDLLYEILEEELRDTISRKKDLVKNGVITHDLIWSIFEPGDIIFSVVNGRQRAFKFDSGKYSRGKFVVSSRYIDFDGKKFGFHEHYFEVSPYEGTSPITALPVFPLVYHADQAAVRKDLIARGKLWEEHKGYHYKEYEGVGIGSLWGQEAKFNIKSRIVIDMEAYNTFNQDDPLHVSSISGEELSNDPDDDEGLGTTNPQTDVGELSDEHRLIATPLLRGYALKEKKWLAFHLDSVKEIVWNEQAFDSLVLPHAQQDLKELILAFAKAQSKHLDAFDDVVQGKSRGVIMLLSGPPGVGKTLTAASVAEVMKVPLYVLSAGDLGTTASRMENNLKDILTMIPRWGAVLLLDEADVFMEARSTTDLVRNELVSIFLRLLEYYEVSKP